MLTLIDIVISDVLFFGGGGLKGEEWLFENPMKHNRFAGQANYEISMNNGF